MGPGLWDMTGGYDIDKIEPTKAILCCASLLNSYAVLVATHNTLPIPALNGKLGLIIPSLCAMDYGTRIMGYDWAWDYGI